MGSTSSGAAKPKEQQKPGGQQGSGPGPSKGLQGGRGQQQQQQQTPKQKSQKFSSVKPNTQGAATPSQKVPEQTAFPCLKCNSTEHRVKDCPLAVEGEAKALIAVPVPESGPGQQDHLDSLFEDDDGCVDVTVDTAPVRAALLDSGADDTVKKCERLPFGDRTLPVTLMVCFDEVILTTSAGPLRWRNLKCWEYDGDDTLSLGIGRPVMKKLGYSTDGCLVKALRKQPVWDLEAMSPTNIALAGSDALSSVDKPPIVRVQQLRERVRLEDDIMSAPDEKDFRASTPAVDQDKSKTTADVRSALEATIQDAVGQGLPPNAAKELRRIVFQREDVFRLKFGGDPPLKAPPLEVHLKSGAKPVKCYPPLHREFLERHVDELVKAGLLYENHRSRWASPALAVPKQDDGLRMVVDTHRVNKCTEPMTWPMPNLEMAMSSLEGSEFYFVLDRFRGYRQLLLARICQEMHTIMTHKGMYTPTRVPMGASDSVAHCQGSVELVFGDILYHGVLAWLDDILGYESSISGLLNLLERVLQRCSETRASIPDYAKLSGVLYELLDVAANVAKSRKKNIPARVKLSDVGWDRTHEEAVAVEKERC
ncbi:hypothetical protein ON010_g14392 [Phytophthora cinnamomi]|nr:hypothetical protein ON010_g14392 [Phytophthora cinnamomi]